MIRSVLDRSQDRPVTLGLTALAVAAYSVAGPAESSEPFQGLGALLVGVFRHGTLTHLALNLTLLAASGFRVEPVLGTLLTVFLAASAAVLGTAAELWLSGPGFVGLSGVAYAFAACTILHPDTAPWPRATALTIIPLILLAEWVFLRDDLAVYTHITGATTGGLIAMFSNLLGKKGPHLKQMKWEHVSKVIPIIAETDEDDAAEAEELFLKRGFDNMFVLVDRGEVLGLTGFGVDETVPDLAWLSWTYLGQAYQGQGLGNQMFNDLLGMLNKQGVRKIFIETSDYIEDGEAIYADAHRLYEEFGAGVELTVPDFHQPGEAKIIYGLNNPEAPESVITPDAAEPGLAITGVEKAAESDNVADLRWEETPTGYAGGDFALNRAREQGFRKAVLAIPSDISRSQAEMLQAQGFRHLGQLADYYGSGLGQDWWAHDLAP